MIKPPIKHTFKTFFSKTNILKNAKVQVKKKKGKRKKKIKGRQEAKVTKKIKIKNRKKFNKKPVQKNIPCAEGAICCCRRGQ